MKVAGCLLLLALCVVSTYHMAIARDVLRITASGNGGATEEESTAASTEVTSTIRPVAEVETDPDPEWEIVYSVWMEQLQRDLADAWDIQETA